MDNNAFFSMSDDDLRLAMAEYESLRASGVVPDGGILAPIRDRYCDTSVAGLHIMEMDLLYAVARRWMTA